jgi:peptidoglycan-associated lipoprotein
MTKLMKWKLSSLVMAMAFSLAGCGGGSNVKPDGDAETQAEAETSAESQEGQGKGGTWRYGSPSEQKGEVKVMGAEVTTQVPQGSELTEEELAAEDPDAQTSTQEAAMTYEPVVHFGYNEDTLDDKAMDIIKHYANEVLNHPMARVKLLGHTDERGTPEYNLALGERRAKAVKQAMMVFGVTPDRIEVISYGEEKPLIDEHNEAAWAKNRRVEIVIY